MYQAPEQLIALNQANMAAAMRFAGVAFEGAERLLDLQFKAAKSAFADSLQNARALSGVKDLQQFAALNESLAQPTLEKASAYAKSVYDLASETQTELSKLVEEQVADFNKQVVTALDKLVKTAPAGSEVGIAAVKSAIAAVNSAYDNLSKAAKQVSETAKTNFDVAAKQAVSGAKKTARK